MFKKQYFNKKDLKTFFEYGYMEFEWKQASTYYWCFEFPLSTIIFIIIHIIKDLK